MDVMDGSPMQERQHRKDDYNDKPRKGESEHERTAKITQERKEEEGKGKGPPKYVLVRGVGGVPEFCVCIGILIFL